MKIKREQNNQDEKFACHINKMNSWTSTHKKGKIVAVFT
jgi:hypothetical protein